MTLSEVSAKKMPWPTARPKLTHSCGSTWRQNIMFFPEKTQCFRRLEQKSTGGLGQVEPSECGPAQNLKGRKSLERSRCSQIQTNMRMHYINTLSITSWDKGSMVDSTCQAFSYQLGPMSTFWPRSFHPPNVRLNASKGAYTPGSTSTSNATRFAFFVVLGCKA